MFNVTGKTMALFMENCVLGIPKKEKTIWQWNWLSLQLRYYLYTMQRLQKIPTVEAFKATLRATIETVKAGFGSLGEHRLFRKNWQKWLDAMEYDAHDMEY